MPVTKMIDRSAFTTRRSSFHHFTMQSFKQCDQFPFTGGAFQLIFH
jgi:hypothetical protein